jgi:hypothetical protein
LWPFSARLTTGFCTHPHTFVPGRGNPIRHHHWRRPELRLGQEGPEPIGKGSSSCFCTQLVLLVARRISPGEMRTPAPLSVTVCTAPPRPAPPRRFAAKSEPKIEPCTLLHPCAPKRTHVHARPHRHGHPSHTAVFRRRVEPWCRRCRARHPSRVSPFS